VLNTRIKERISKPLPRPDLALVLLGIWGFFIVYATTLPFDFSGSLERAATRLRAIAQHPLRGGSWRDVWANVLLFIPWGFLICVHAGRRGLRFLTIMSLALFSGACLSGAVELLQLFSPRRHTSFVDVVTNTFGSVVGALAAWPVTQWIWPVLIVRLRQLVVWRPLESCSLCVAAGMVLAAASPFSPRLSPGELRQAFQAARFIPFGPALNGAAPARSVGPTLQELLTWVLAGGLFALSAKEADQRGRTAVQTAMTAAAGLSLVIEVIHLAVRGRDADLSSVVLALVGSGAGAAAAVSRFADQPRRAITPALFIWGVAVLLSSWDPLTFRWPGPPYWHPEWLVPFWSYFRSRSLADLGDVTVQALRFAPLGALLAARSWRQTLLQVVIFAFVLALCFETGQAFLPRRTADMSDVLTAAAGAAAGWALFRWGESLQSSSAGHVKYRVPRK
jgi:glycopeptide antibiotics resistance protein